MTARYAIYFAPAADSALWRFATSWLGRDPEAGIDIKQPEIAGLPAETLARVTSSPRRYGFHGTLKPPFRLAQGADPDGLRGELSTFAADRTAFDLPPLRVSALDGFLALTPTHVSKDLDDLAADCVRAFDAFRAPPDEDELARRRAHGLNDRQATHLARWGYPYVLDQFRFHMTLSERLDEGLRETVQRILEREAAPALAAPVRIDSFALFHEPAQGAQFRLIARFAFADL